MADTCATMKIEDNSETGYAVINVSDFDSEVHKNFVEKKTIEVMGIEKPAESEKDDDNTKTPASPAPAVPTRKTLQS